MDALKRIALTDPKRAWLRAHLDAPDCTATEADLAEAAGQPIAEYRALAAEFAAALDADLPEEPLALLAERTGEGWRLRAPLAFALGIHRVVPDAWTRGGKDAAKLQPVPGESPIVVLVRPQLAENIGTTARAMANGGLFHLRLVAPRDGWPQDRAWRTASGADAILEAAQVFPDVPSALADCHRVFATCPRPRHMIKPLRTARAAAEDVREINGRGLRCAVMFGPERAGLEADDMAHADTLVRYPLNPAHMSLNLAQAVMIFAYEWWTATEPTAPRKLITNGTPVATKGLLEGFLDRLISELDASGFLEPEKKRANMVRNLRHWFERGEVTEQELRTLHGVVTELSQGRMRRGRPDLD
ncbi:tRNA/rRNA methyltransferase [Belnapia rosea]|nr:tRNA/rRNA methyltransferase [Belnapia rosea]